MNKKKILTLSLIIILLAILSFSSLAWFSDAENVENKFYVASSDDDSADDIFSVDVYEDVDTDDDGEDERVDEGTAVFENILPGEKIEKAPYVQNTGSYEQWVRLTLTFASQDAWYAIQDENTSGGPIALLTFAADFAEKWEGGSYNADGDKYVYVYYLKETLTPDEVVDTFTHVNIPTTLTQEDMFGIKELTLDVKAEAVQVDNVPAGSAKEAFKIVMGE